MDNLWSVLNQKITSGEDAVLATITAAHGSVPRGSGARMLVDKGGRVAGTVGGGAVEFESIKIAKEMLTEKSCGCRHFYLDKNEIADIGMVCGGDVDILFQYISGSNEEMCRIVEKIVDCKIRSKACNLIYTFSDKDDIGMKIISEGIEIGSEIEGSVRRYTEMIVSSEKVYIFGGGHVAQQLVPTLARCDFACTVIEDRPEFADPSLFESKCDIILVREGTLSENLPDITENDYVCIMTRGHKDDYKIQADVLKSKAHYIGVIGSRRKIAAVNEKLMSDGFTKADIDRITTPIGIDIMSETPAEIAVSIAAQLIKVRAIKNGREK